MDAVIEARLKAIESMIRKATNNNFQMRRARTKGNFVNGVLYVDDGSYFRVGDTIEISDSELNSGLMVVTENESGAIPAPDAYDELEVTATKVVYPDDVKMGVVNLLKWQLKNEAENSGETEAKEVASETISRHSVSYVTDATNTALDDIMGIPKKYTEFLKRYRKARF